MKLKLIVIVFIFLGACITHKESEYNIPPDVSKETEKQYIKRFDKGKKLYLDNCAKCHSVKVKGKWVIPEFNPLQLRSYTIRIQNKDHTSNLSEKSLSEEELSTVVFYLMYRKTNKPKK